MARGGPVRASSLLTSFSDLSEAVVSRFPDVPEARFTRFPDLSADGIYLGISLPEIQIIVVHAGSTRGYPWLSLPDFRIFPRHSLPDFRIWALVVSTRGFRYPKSGS